MLDQELIDQADMYASTCTRQEEKFSTWARWGCPWRWRDCEGAYDLIREAGAVVEALDRCTRRVEDAEHWRLFPVLARKYGWEPSEAWNWDNQPRVGARGERTI